MALCTYSTKSLKSVTWLKIETDDILANVGLNSLLYFLFRNESGLAITRLCAEIVLQNNQRDVLHKIRFSCRNETSVNKQNWNETLENGTLPSVNRAGGH
jgi:hypothetical protein